ncbi:T9SS type A sorting domain-containing protein [candidate division KSB1 bacterium]|nr:T9SS type A sorting domain-containing protein [candidate division KSB1 bacterium]
MQKMGFFNICLTLLIWLVPIILMAPASNPAATLRTELTLTLQIHEIKIKNDRDVDNTGEFHFFRKLLGASVRLPQSGDISRQAGEFIRPTDPNLAREPFWKTTWVEDGTAERLLEFDGYESDSWPDTDDPLGAVNTTLDLTTFEFLRLNTGRVLEAGDYTLSFTVQCAPLIRSDTHPDSTRGYYLRSVSLDWIRTLPAIGISGYSYLLDQASTTEPDDTLEGTYLTVTYLTVAPGTWWFHLKARDKMDFWSNTGHFKIQILPSTGGVNPIQQPRAFELGQNYPNPFNQTTQIAYSLDQTGFAALEIWNLQGVKIRTLVAENQSAGAYQIAWDGRDQTGQLVASGTYFYLFRRESMQVVRRLILLR